MWVSRRKHDGIVLDLVAEAWSRRHERDAAVKRAETAEANMRVMARQIDRLSEDNIGQARLIRALQRQLDGALGMDDPAVAAGAGWQTRRPDKPKPAAPDAAPADREPGEVAP